MKIIPTTLMTKTISLSSETEDVFGFIAYISVFIIALLHVIFVFARIRKQSKNQRSFFAFILLFVAAMTVSLAYISDKFDNIFNFGFRGGETLTGPESLITSIIGYTIAAIAINVFLLQIINFRQNTKRFIRILAFISGGVMILLDLALIVLNVLTEYLGILAENDFDDYITIIMGLLTIGIMIFTVIGLFIEASRNASKMIRLRLRLAAVATLSFVFEGFSNALTLVFDQLNVNSNFRDIYSTYIIPGTAIIFYLVYIFGYYYTLFPPLWLQKAFRVLPPSFLRLVQKEEQLKNTMEVQ
jgi:hypothetical protein